MDRIKVTIINHDKNYIDTLSNILSTDQNFKISGTATNEYDAYHLICHTQPDIILTDIKIADFNTFLFIEKVKNTTSLKKVPKFIIITASGNESIISQAFQHDITYFILTPFEPNYVLNRIKQIIENDFISNKNENSKKQDSPKAIDNMDYSISTLLYKLGIPSNIKGYKYVKSALKKCTLDISKLDGVTKQLYPEIAKEFKTTSTSVEHAIRNLVKNSCEHEHTELFSLLFGNELNKTLTNTEFIYTISNSLRVNYTIS